MAVPGNVGADKKRKPFSKWFILGCVLIVMVPVIGAAFYVYQPNTWGSEGTLSISITLDKTNMSMNDTINATIVLKNTGSTKVRLYVYMNSPYYTITGTDGNSVKYKYFGPAMAPPRRLTDQQFNAELKELKPGDTLTETNVIRRYINGTDPHDGISGWDLKANETYKVTGEYDSERDRTMVYPYWTGAVKSEPVSFTVHG